MKYFQHGDVKITVVNKIPGDAKKLEHLVLMDGEITGHKHQVVQGEAILYEKNGVLFLKANTDCTVGHEEHKAITVPKGNYEIGRVVEYDPFEDSIRAVRD